MISFDLGDETVVLDESKPDLRKCPLQAVDFVLDQCGGAVVDELEGVGVGPSKVDESACRAAGETPGGQR